MKLRFSLLHLLLAGVLAASAAAPGAGLSGEPLKNRLAATCRPLSLYRGDMLEMLRRLDAHPGETGLVVNRMDPARPLAEEFTTNNIVDPDWWRGRDDNYGDTLTLDLHNCILVPLGAPIQGTPPGDISCGENSTGVFGTTPYGGEDVACFTPAQQYRGDIARAYFYMATLYPAGYWKPEAELVMRLGRYPSLSAYGRETLLKWAREDPVSDEERRRNTEIEETQGNRNPFVDYPELAEYIWGDNSEDTFLPTDEPTPLRGTYHLADKMLYLTSPYIPAEATWEIDGKAVSGTAIPLDVIGLGRHVLTFTSPTTRGSLQIEVKP